MIKASIHQEDTMTLITYAPDNRASKYIEPRPIMLKGETDNSTIIIGDFNPLVSN